MEEEFKEEYDEEDYKEFFKHFDWDRKFNFEDMNEFMHLLDKKHEKEKREALEKQRYKSHRICPLCLKEIRKSGIFYHVSSKLCKRNR